jgi:hypothetical protein
MQYLLAMIETRILILGGNLNKRLNYLCSQPPLFSLYCVRARRLSEIFQLEIRSIQVRIALLSTVKGEHIDRQYLRPSANVIKSRRQIMKIRLIKCE